MRLTIEELVEHAIALRPKEAVKIEQTLEDLERADLASWRDKFHVVKAESGGNQPSFARDRGCG